VLVDKFNGIKSYSETLQKEFESQMTHMGRTEQLQLELAITTKEIEIDLLKQDRVLQREILTLKREVEKFPGAVSSLPSGRDVDRHAALVVAVDVPIHSDVVHRNTDDLMSRMDALSRRKL
jgi:hypothetical protein